MRARSSAPARSTIPAVCASGPTATCTSPRETRASANSPSGEIRSTGRFCGSRPLNTARAPASRQSMRLVTATPRASRGSRAPANSSQPTTDQAASTDPAAMTKSTSSGAGATMAGRAYAVAVTATSRRPPSYGKRRSHRQAPPSSRAAHGEATYLSQHSRGVHCDDWKSMGRASSATKPCSRTGTGVFAPSSKHPTGRCGSPPATATATARR